MKFQLVLLIFCLSISSLEERLSFPAQHNFCLLLKASEERKLKSEKEGRGKTSYRINNSYDKLLLDKLYFNNFFISIWVIFLKILFLNLFIFQIHGCSSSTTSRRVTIFHLNDEKSAFNREKLFYQVSALKAFVTKK